MFGPDQCGGTKRVHLIFNYKDKNHLVKREVRPESDVFTHLYTAVIFPDQTYQIRIDNEIKQSGSLLEDWDFLPPKEIPDPSQSKPADWVDEQEIPDPEAKKPEGWDDIPKQIADPEAKKPDDWDDELDGEWEPPMIDNPEYKGEWAAPTIKNPAYKGTLSLLIPLGLCSVCGGGAVPYITRIHLFPFFLLRSMGSPHHSQPRVCRG